MQSLGGKMQKQISIPTVSKILITGGTGMLGKALTTAILNEGFKNVVSIGSKDVDLRDSDSVKKLMIEVKPDFVFHLAARVYGLGGNALYKSDVLVDNVFINTNVIEYARQIGVKKIVAMGSGCVYPELKDQDELYENQIWLGPPHPSEDSYAHSKRLMLAQLNAAKEQYNLSSAFVISGNLYGEFDSFNKEEGHVIPSLIAKFFEAKQSDDIVKVWGSGSAIRDFTYSKDAAKALISILYNLEGPVNLGSGQRHPIKDIVKILQDLTGVSVEWDASKSDGQLVRYYNLNKLNKTSFQANVELLEGISLTYKWFAKNWATARK
jgi:GDP-L-fucose synthase